MPIFAIIGHKEIEKLRTNIQAAFQDNYYLAPSTWFISAVGTSAEIAQKVGVADGKSGIQGVVLGVSAGWYGYAPQDLWEWLKSRLEAKPNV